MLSQADATDISLTVVANTLAAAGTTTLTFPSTGSGANAILKGMQCKKILVTQRPFSPWEYRC